MGVVPTRALMFLLFFPVALRGRRALVRDLHSEVIYETQLAHLVPGCGGGHVRLLEAAVDHAVDHAERPIVDDFAAPGRLDDAAGFRHNDSSGFELVLYDAAGGFDHEHSAPAAVGQQRAEIIRGRARAARPCGQSDIPALPPGGGAVNIGAVPMK